MEHKIVNCPHCGKIIAECVLKGESKRKTVACPECDGHSSFKDGFGQTKKGMVQCYLCRDCADLGNP